MTEPKPLTHEERNTLLDTLRLGSWRFVQNPEECVARCLATVATLEAEVARLTERRDSWMLSIDEGREILGESDAEIAKLARALCARMSAATQIAMGRLRS